MTLSKDLIFGDLQSEFQNTRTLMEAIPQEHFDWKPHEKSWHIGGLANHLSMLPMWKTMILTTDELDLANMPPFPEAPTEIGPILEAFDKNRADFENALAGASEEDFTGTWTLRMGEKEIMSGPKMVLLRSMGVNHVAHHRGQLTVFLRLLDVPVPMTHGPTADEQGAFG